MVDCTSMRRVDPSYFQRSSHMSFMDETAESMTTIPDDKLYLCEPFVYGFSFAAKKWGEIAVGQLEDVIRVFLLFFEV